MVYITHYGTPGSVFVFDPDGKFVRSLGEFHQVIDDGKIPLIVILPSAKDVEKRAEGRRPKHAALIEYLDRKGYRYFDFLDTLEEEHGRENLRPKELYVNTHFNGEANKLLAEEIIEVLELQ